MKSKTGILLINLGTPDSPSVRDVRTYLSQFLNENEINKYIYPKAKRIAVKKNSKTGTIIGYIVQPKLGEFTLAKYILNDFL